MTACANPNLEVPGTISALFPPGNGATFGGWEAEVSLQLGGPGRGQDACVWGCKNKSCAEPGMVMEPSVSVTRACSGCRRGRTPKTALGSLPAAAQCLPQLLPSWDPVPSCRQGQELSTGHLQPGAPGCPLQAVPPLSPCRKLFQHGAVSPGHRGVPGHELQSSPSPCPR